jgi:hypothetical protein
MLRPLAALAFLLTLPSPAQDAAAQIRTHIQSLQQSLKDKPITAPEFAAAITSTETQLKSASDAVDAGLLYLSLEKLSQAANLIQGARTYVDKTAAVNNSLPAFESEWGKTSKNLAALDHELASKNWSSDRAALRALAETARVKTVPLMDGARGFATATKPNDGLFYLGQAQGEAEFSRFCASLHLPRTARPLPLRSLLPELLALQDKTNAAFQPPRSIELHPRFIALNSTLKLARELDSSKLYAGALYQYLEAIRHYSMLDAPALDPAARASLKQALAAERKKLSASPDDDSVAQIFLERAVEQTSAAATPDEWRSASVIVHQVLPAFAAVRKSAAPLARPTGKTVEITLVRWPYT